MSKITLSMIVKNEGKHLAGCLNSVKDVVDEIVIVDTGSQDNTLKIAKEYNARIFHFEWINDFSAARNFALRKSTGDWILYLDADERIYPDSKEELKRITASKEKIGYYCIVKSLDSGYGRDNQMSYVRLFSNSPNIVFNSCVHEQIIPSLLKNGYELKKSNILIEHIGYNVNSNSKKEKANRNLELLLHEYRTNKNPYLEFQLALTYEVLGNSNEARNYFLSAAENKNFSKLYRAHSYTSLAVICNNEHNISESEKYLEKSLSLRNNDAFTHLLAAKIYLRKNEVKKAIEHCKKAELFNQELKRGKGNKDYSVILNDEELILFGLTIAKKTGDANSLINYHRKYFHNINSSELIEKEKIVSIIGKLTENKPIEEHEVDIICNYANNTNIALLIFMLRGYLQNKSKAILIEKLQQIFPNNTELKKSRAELYISSNESDKAAEIYRELAEGNNDDPSIYFYLLSFYISDSNYDKLFQTIRKVEDQFSNIPEVIDRINLIKAKLTGISLK